MFKIVIVGGSGKIAKLFSRLATSTSSTSSPYSITSLVRSRDHFDAISQVGATPQLLDIESAQVDELKKAFEGAQGVLFAAGAGGKGPKERTRKVDEEGAIKVFDAIEQISSAPKPYLVLVGALDTRDISQKPPTHYTEEDIEGSKKAHEAIGPYYDAKLAADLNLSRRTAFAWTIVRPGSLLDDEPTGKVTAGQTGMGKITRGDVASSVLALFNSALAEHGSSSSSSSKPKANGLAIDLIQQGDGKDVPFEEAIKAAVEKREGSLVA
ncbi:hypothetical protein JCM10908_005195 [Rhodotorula pacifica]|uniref:uncharacterized protein n=1 Tax=Rhodotorula pacifica TaxID=1495444 RepID=UPI00317DE22E